MCTTNEPVQVLSVPEDCPWIFIVLGVSEPPVHPGQVSLIAVTCADCPVTRIVTLAVTVTPLSGGVPPLAVSRTRPRLLPDVKAPNTAGLNLLIISAAQACTSVI